MESKKISKPKIVSKMTKDMWVTLLGYGATHWIADMCAGAIVYATLIRYGYGAWDFFVLVVLYNFLSFGLQLMFGIFIDKYQVPREATFISFVLIGLAYPAYLLFADPVLVVLLAGIGDSLYHVGAGSISLNFMPRKAVPVGVFVAPGALGLFCGIVIGKTDFTFFTVLFLLASLIAMAIFVALREIPKINYNAKSFKKVDYFVLINFFLACSVAIRSMHGLATGFDWKFDQNTFNFLGWDLQVAFWLQFALVFGISLGKGIGGFLADRFGWIKVGVISLLISAIPMAFFKGNVVLAILGMTIFQITMAITLTTRSLIFEGRSATAFGFFCMTLMIGACPIYLGAETLKPFIQKDWNTFFVILFSATAIFICLFLIKDYFKKELKVNM